MGLSINEGEGPRFERPIDSKKAIEVLGVPELEDDLGYVIEAVRMIHHELGGSVPLIGFAGSPWTLATYMVEGQSTQDFARIKALMYEQPHALHTLLDILTESVGGYLAAQVGAGADVLMVFDTWGGVLPHAEYREFSLSAMRRIVETLKSDELTRHIPVILFTKGGGQWLKEMADSGCDALGCDWTTSLTVARKAVGEQVALQGNLDPAVLYARPEVIERAVERVLDDFGVGHGHVFNLGHGITPGVDPDHVRVMVDAVHQKSRRN